MLQAVASTQTAREAGRRGNFAETPVAVVFRMEDAYLAVGLKGDLAFAGSEVGSRTWFCQFTIDILFWRLLC